MFVNKLINEIALNIEFRTVIDSYKSTSIIKLSSPIPSVKQDLDKLVRHYWSEAIPILGIKKINIICFNYKSNKLYVVASCYLAGSEFRKAKIDSLYLEMNS